MLSNPKLPKNIKQLIAGGYEKIAIRITDNLKIKLLIFPFLFLCFIKYIFRKRRGSYDCIDEKGYFN